MARYNLFAAVAAYREYVAKRIRAEFAGDKRAARDFRGLALAARRQAEVALRAMGSKNIAADFAAMEGSR